MKKSLMAFVIVCLYSLNSYSQIPSNQWSATDALGRKLTNATSINTTKNGKYVGIFYSSWHSENLADIEVGNITDILNQYPEAINNFDHPGWKGKLGTYWWDEPLYGYYRTTDDWVLRKHAEVLADAGVDFVFFDCTNGTNLWKDSYTKIAQVWGQAIVDGVKAPKMVFMLPFADKTNTVIDLNNLYNDFYKSGLNSNLWFMLNNKPLILALPEISAMDGQSAAMKFTASNAFGAINAACPSWSNSIGNLTFSLYKWETNYATSVSKTPLATKTFVNFNDNAKLALEFSSLPAGDYVWVLKDGIEQVGVWKWADSTDPVTSYFGGQVVTGNYDSEIAYNTTLNFTKLATGKTRTPVTISGLSISQSRVDSIKAFFTFRTVQPAYKIGPTRVDQWSWLEVAPQHGFGLKTDGKFEQMSVGVGQNTTEARNGAASAFNQPLSFGRSYTKENGQNTEDKAYLKGLNFQEQWNYAHKADPDVVTVTGWNEWIGGRFNDWDVQPVAFVDIFSAEKSRDIEFPKRWGDHADNYYLQLTENIRKFKGMAKADTLSTPKTINTNDLTGWDNVKPDYITYKGNTFHRNHRGTGLTQIYTNNTGRNDFTKAKVTNDLEYIYFYIQTNAAITSKEDPKWMRLFIDIDKNKSTGWQGYDFIVNRISPTDSAYVDKCNSTTWNWSNSGKAAYVINNNTLVLKLKKSVLGLSNSDQLNFEFKWSDNMQEEGNIMDFYVNGDVAPTGRFNYNYKRDIDMNDFYFAQNPEKLNQGVKCEVYYQTFETLPVFSSIISNDTLFLSNIYTPTLTADNYGLKYTGYIDVPEDNTYNFYLNSQSISKLVINGKSIVSTDASGLEKSGAIKLRKGKHLIEFEYITKVGKSKDFSISYQFGTTTKTTIPNTSLFKFNVNPTASIKFNFNQLYYNAIDSVVQISGYDKDGSVSKIEMFDNGTSIGIMNKNISNISGFSTGNHSVYAKVFDNDGQTGESMKLNFTVKDAIELPGNIVPENYANSNSVSIISSNDVDLGNSIRSAYGWSEYYINPQQNGNYQLTFRVPASTSGLKTINIKINGVLKGSLDVSKVGNAQPWYSISTNINLNTGNQKLQLEFKGVVTVHKINFDLTSAIDDIVKYSTMIYPNAGNQSFMLKSELPIQKVIVYNTSGIKVEEQNYNNDIFQTDIGKNIQPGVYMVLVLSKSGFKSQIKLLKQSRIQQ